VTTESKPTVTPVIVTDSGKQCLEAFRKEIAAYRRALPRLLEEGHAGRQALVKGDQVLSVWDTRADAFQHAYDRFGLDEPFLVQRIDPRDTERLALLDAQTEASCPS
jgi:hypothetical protein